jgi:hypothetical protein
MIVTENELLRSIAKLMVEAWIAANHESVRRCPLRREGSLPVIEYTATNITYFMISVDISRLTGMNASGSCFKIYFLLLFEYNFMKYFRV